MWNKVVTKRIEIFGRKVLIGDLVQMPEGTLGNLTTEEINDGEYLGTKPYLNLRFL